MAKKEKKKLEAYWRSKGGRPFDEVHGKGAYQQLKDRIRRYMEPYERIFDQPPDETTRYSLRSLNKY